MPSPVKFDIVIPESHRVELTFPEDLPPGPAEVIVLPASSNAAKEKESTAKGARNLADLFEGRLGLIDSRGQERLSEPRTTETISTAKPFCAGAPRSVI